MSANPLRSLAPNPRLVAAPILVGPRSRRWAGRAGLAGSLIALTTLSLPAAADVIDEFAQRLSTLRGEVESLSSELSTLTADGRDELRSLRRQKADLELEVQKEETRLQKLQVAVHEKRELIARDQGRDAELDPTFQANLARVRQYVSTSLPFRREERLKALDKLAEQLSAGLLTAPRALARLWTFVEDEFRLTRESGLYQQPVTIDGQEQLADVVRIGTVMLFFKTSDGVVGHAVKQAADYEYTVTHDPEGRKQILGLFASFQKQLRSGYFTLPTALDLKGAR